MLSNFPKPGIRAATRLWPIFFTLYLASCKPLDCATCQVVEKEPAYTLAQGCYTLQNSDNTYLVSSENSYDFSGTFENQAELFYLKPTRLGAFLLFDRQGHFLSKNLLNITSQDDANSSSEWEINLIDIFKEGILEVTGYTMISAVNSLRLQIVDDKATLSIAPIDTNLDVNKTYIKFEQRPQDSCAQFPEAALDADVSPEFYQEKDPADPIVGYADIHTHIGFPQTMGGVAMAGEIYHPYGIEHALHDCDDIHGKNGVLDFLEGQKAGSGSGGHDTEGYPDFSYWPRSDTTTHVTAYYRWIQRAHLSGLRLMVTLVTGNPSFCQLLSIVQIGKSEGGCTGNSALKRQTEYMYELEDYIDAQEGGPGKGWLRIVTTPEEARAAIAKNQLAIVLGVEHGTLFNCDESFGGCTEDYVSKKLDEAYDMGIRSIFPIHRFDNAFGGTKPGGGSAGAWMHLTGMMTTSKIDHILDLINPTKLLFKADAGGHFWDMDTCPEGAQGTSGIANMEDFLDDSFSFFTDAAAGIPLVRDILEFGINTIFINKLDPIPTYASLSDIPGGTCNQRGLQPIGVHLINRMIDKGMILEVDHLSYATLDAALDIIEERQYSGVVSSHGWLNDTAGTRARILSLGGLLSMKGAPSGAANSIAKYEEEMQPYDYALGLSMGSDIQGVSSQPGGDNDVIINYPFTSVDGLVTFTEPKTGNRTFDFANEGIAHYGLYAEWVENLRQVDEKSSEGVMGNFMNSAEAYVQMWERASAHSQ